MKSSLIRCAPELQWSYFRAAPARGQQNQHIHMFLISALTENICFHCNSYKWADKQLPKNRQSAALAAHPAHLLHFFLLKMHEVQSSPSTVQDRARASPCPRADVQQLPQAAPGVIVTLFMCSISLPQGDRLEKIPLKHRDKILTKSTGLAEQGREADFVTLLQYYPCDLLQECHRQCPQQWQPWAELCSMDTCRQGKTGKKQTQEISQTPANPQCVLLQLETHQMV